MIELFTGLSLCRFCAGNHSCHDFLCARAVSCLEDSISQHFSTPSSSSIISVPFSEIFSDPSGGVWYICSIYVWLGILSCLFFELLWVSAFTIYYNKTQLPISWAVHIYECKYKYLEDNLTTWPCSKTTWAGLPLGPKIFLSIFFSMFIVQAWSPKRWEVRVNHSQRDCYKPKHSQGMLTYMFGRLCTVTKYQVSKIKHFPEGSFLIHVISKTIWKNS